MPRLFVNNAPEDGTLVLSGEDARYIHTVLRMRPGAALDIIDSQGTVHHSVVVAVSKGRVEARVERSEAPLPEPAHGIVLLQGMLKGQKMDLVVQKAVELGVKRIVPLITERSQVRETRKTGRWRTIAGEAARQCGRTVVPEVDEPVDFPLFFSDLRGSVSGFVFWEEGGAPLSLDTPIPSAVDIFAAVGPEGGLTVSEVEVAQKAGLEVASLGPRILRAETAAITSVALLEFLSGGLGMDSG